MIEEVNDVWRQRQFSVVQVEGSDYFLAQKAESMGMSTESMMLSTETTMMMSTETAMMMSAETAVMVSAETSVRVSTETAVMVMMMVSSTQQASNDPQDIPALSSALGHCKQGQRQNNHQANNDLKRNQILFNI